jgi:hypothetical protein
MNRIGSATQAVCGRWEWSGPLKVRRRFYLDLDERIKGRDKSKRTTANYYNFLPS